MDRRTGLLLGALFAIVVGGTALATTLLGGSGTGGDGPPPGTSQATGVIVAVDSRGLGDVRGFTLRDGSGALLEFGLAELESGTEFPPGHLAEHQATAEPVRVWFRESAGARLAIRIEDAPRP